MSQYSKQQKNYVDFKEQIEICKKFGASFLESPQFLKVGISRNVRDGVFPINGLRHRPEGDTTGWYIWAGEDFSYISDFFIPLHVEHLKDWCPGIIKYLGLAPGWRFLIAPSYEDVWEDKSLLNLGD